MRREKTIGITYVEIGGMVVLHWGDNVQTTTLWVQENERPLLWVRVSPYRFAQLAQAGLIWSVDGAVPSTEDARWHDLVPPETHKLVEHGLMEVITVAELARHRLRA